MRDGDGRVRRALVALVVAALVAAGCGLGGDDDGPERAGDDPSAAGSSSSTVGPSVGPDVDPSVGPGPGPTDGTTDGPTGSDAPSTTGVAGAPSPAVPTVAWSSCGAGAECATVAVPLDHDDPGGPTIDLAVRRLPASGDRIGALFLNFGGPGAGAADLVARFGVPSSVRARFDIVGMDPRGVAGSTALDCGFDAATLYAVDPTIEDDGDVAALLDVSRRYVDDCATTRGELLPHLGTRNVARDMDLVRAGMGDETLSFLGFSYGTSIGQSYAELFPGRVRGMVLDGLVDPAPAGIDVAAEQAQGFETALANWAADCDNRSSCAFADPLGAVDAMLAAAENGVPSNGGRRDLGPGEAAVGLAYPLYLASLWPQLDRAVASALDGDGSRMVAMADAYAGPVDFSIYFAVSCLDSTWPRSTDAFLDAAKRAGATSPRFGEAIVNDYIRCALWPPDPEPLGAISAPGAPPILVVSGTGDPATPYENGVRVADRLESGVLVTYDGEGHTITFQGSSCIDALVGAYLIDRVVPDDGVRCT